MSSDLVFGAVSELGAGANIELLSMSPPPKHLVGNHIDVHSVKKNYDPCGICNVMDVSLKSMLFQCCILPTLKHT